MKKALKIIFIVLVGIIAIGIINAIFSKDNNKGTTKSATDSSSTAKEESKADGNWIYNSDSSDKMTNKITTYAQCKSLNSIDLKSPYGGGVHGYINIRNGFKNEHNTVYITVDKGQFMPSISSEESIKVKFDNSNPVSYSYSEPSDGSSGTIFLEESGLFLEKLKKSSHVIIEATFFDNGYKQFEFDTKGLVWDKK